MDRARGLATEKGRLSVFVSVCLSVRLSFSLHVGLRICLTVIRFAFLFVAKFSRCLLPY